MSANTPLSVSEKYKELLSLIDSFLGEAKRSQDPAFGYASDEVDATYRGIINKSELNRVIFIKVLNLIGNGTLKNVNIESENLPGDILKFHKHSIIENICISTQKQIKTQKFHKRYYQDNFVAFYIILDHYLSLSKEKMPRRFCAFMEAMYFGFCDLLYKYVAYYGNISSSELHNLPSAGVSPIRHDLNILTGIRSLLYTGFSSDDSVNIAVFALRGYLESWVRAAFDVFLSHDGKYIPINTVLEAVRKVSDSPDFDVEQRKYIKSISTINDWSNFYIHWKPKTIFWVPHFIDLYLTFFSDMRRDKLIEDTGTWHVTPPLTQKDSDFYINVRKELAAYLA